MSLQLPRQPGVMMASGSNLPTGAGTMSGAMTGGQGMSAPPSMSSIPSNLSLMSASASISFSSPSSSTTTVNITSSIVDELMEERYDDSARQNDPNRWFFTKEQLENTPSRRAGIEADKELNYRQQSANYIQDIGQRLQVNQLCINTAIVYMHRFFMFHSFSTFHRNSVSTASVFLAAKVEEQPRKLEYVIKVAHYCLFRETQPPIDLKSDSYTNLASELVSNENVLLQTLGFDVGIDHPHTHVVKCCQLVRASKDLAQTSYFMATNSLHLTTMCLEYRSSVVACVCIHLACKWSNWEIPRSKEGKDWFWYVDGQVTMEQLEQYTNEFLTIFNKSPSRLKKKIMSLSLNAATRGNASNLNAFPSHFNLDPSSPGMPQFPKSRSPSPSDGTGNVNAGKLRLPQVKPGGPQPLFQQLRPVVKPGVPVPPPHQPAKPHPTGGSGGHPPQPAPRPSAHPLSSTHPLPNKGVLPPHPQQHPLAPPHGIPKDQHQKPHQAPGPFHPNYHSSFPSGMAPSSYPTNSGRPQPSHSNNSQPHQSSSLSQLVSGTKALFPPQGNSSQLPMNSQPKQPFTGTYQQQQQQIHLKPTNPTFPPRLPLPGQIGQQGQPNPLKRPFPAEITRPEIRPEMVIKREPLTRPNHVSLPQSHMPTMSSLTQRPFIKPEVRHPSPLNVSGAVHQSPSVAVTPLPSPDASSLPPAVDGRPWMDRFLDNEVLISPSATLKPLIPPKPQPQPQLHVSSSGLPAALPTSTSTPVPSSAPVLSAQVSSTSSLQPVATTASSHLLSNVTTLEISASSISSMLSMELVPSSTLPTLTEHQSKKKKEKKHKKDKHREKDEKEHKHKDKHKEKEEKKHKKEHKEKHKEKHKKDKRRPSEDFTLDSGGNKLKIIIGRNPNPNSAQESKDSNSKSSKHSKDHHTATIINY